MLASSHLMTRRILAAIGLLSGLGASGCFVSSSCPSAPEPRNDAPHDVEIAPGCTTNIEGDDTTAVSCVPKTNPQGDCPAADDPAAEDAVREALMSGTDEDVLRSVVCFTGENTDTEGNATCCYGVVRDPEPYYCEGRPFHVDGKVTVAALTGNADWLGAGAGPSDLDRQVCAELAAAWAQDGLYEHASVASFARFVLDLLAVGAPPYLVREAQQAMADEVLHAELCFALASRYAGTALGPGALPMPSTLGDRTTLALAAAEAVREGCVGETIAALVAQTAAEHAQDPEARRALTRIAEDEARHAELAYRFVAWALAQGELGVRDAVERAFAESTVDIAGPPVEEMPLDLLHAHGRLSQAERRNLAKVALREVIAPCGRALLGIGGSGEKPTEKPTEVEFSLPIR